MTQIHPSLYRTRLYLSCWTKRSNSQLGIYTYGDIMFIVKVQTVSGGRIMFLYILWLNLPADAQIQLSFLFFFPESKVSQWKRFRAEQQSVEIFLSSSTASLWLREMRMSPRRLHQPQRLRLSVNVADEQIQPSLRFTPNVYEKIAIGRPRNIFYTRMFNVIYAIDQL